MDLGAAADGIALVSLAGKLLASLVVTILCAGLAALGWFSRKKWYLLSCLVLLLANLAYLALVTSCTGVGQLPMCTLGLGTILAVGVTAIVGLGRCRPRIQFRLRTLLIAILVLSLPLSLAGCMIRNWNDYRIAVYDCGNGRSIEIRRESWCDFANMALYRVMEGNTTVQQKSDLMWVEGGTHLSTSSFELLDADGGQLVALRYRNESVGFDELPDLSARESWTQKLVSATVVLIHDFETHLSWPANESAHDSLLRRLVDEHPEWQVDDQNEEMLQSVQHLKLADTPIGGDELACIAALPNLRHLILSKCTCVDFGRTRVTNLGLAPLGALTNLETLHFYDTPMSDTGLRHLEGLTKLQVLYVSGIQITDAGTKHFRNLTNLHFLNLRGTRVTPEGVEKLQEALPKCEIAYDEAVADRNE